MTDTDDGIIWEGADELRPFLVPIDNLEPFPGNPRRGDVESVRSSLRRFGQVRPLLADGARVVAGHHVRIAAAEEGWTHVAVIAHGFADEEEARAYLLADNRTHDLGIGYDDELLADHLRILAELDALEGTGYTTDDLDDLLAGLRRQLDPPTPPDPADPPTPPSDVTELVLMFSKAQRDQVEVWLDIVAKEKSTHGVSETVYSALELAAHSLNQDAG
jgi:ParB-like chromosome segregation protein Spo0J